MRNLKVILFVLIGFTMNSFFNACGEVRFGNLYETSSKITVTEPNIDEPDEVALINEIFGVPPELEGEYEEEAPDASQVYAADEDSADEDSSDDDSSDDDNKNKKVVICHVPKGNPGNAHTLVVSWSAVRAHVDENHHRSEGEPADYFGECDADI